MTIYRPNLDHPVAVLDICLESRALFASGWHADRTECWVVQPANSERRLVGLETWRGLRELATDVRPGLMPS